MERQLFSINVERVELIYPSKREIPHSKVGSLKRMMSVVFCTSKGYEATGRALVGGNANNNKDSSMQSISI